MPKPQMTHLIDQLTGFGVVERIPNATDRRVTNIRLTSKGLLLFEDLRQKLHETIRNELSGLTPRDLTDMSDALDTIRRIGAKL